MNPEMVGRQRWLPPRFGRVLMIATVAVPIVCILAVGIWIACGIITYRKHDHAADPKYAPYFALLQAVETGNVAAVKSELGRGTDPNSFPPCDEYEEDIAPLCEASDKGDLAIVKLLLDRGADPNVQDGWYDTPLTAAAIHSHLEVMNLLIRRGARVQEGGCSIALWRAAVEGQSKAVTYLIARGADPNQMERGVTLRQAVIQLGHPEIAPLLTKQGGAGK